MALDSGAQKIEWERARLNAWPDAVVAWTVARTGFAQMPEVRMEDFNPFERAERRWPPGGSKEFMDEVRARRVPRWLLAIAPISDIKAAAGES